MNLALAAGVAMLSLGTLTVMRIVSLVVPTSTQRATTTTKVPLLTEL